MKSLRDYLEESEHAANNPVEGDMFVINIREECLIESVVVESLDDGVVIAADDRMIELLESYGYTFEENYQDENVVDESVLASLPRPNKRNQFKSLHKLKKSHNENVEEGQLPETAKQDSAVARAMLHRILMQHTGMLAAHGPERVMAAVDEVADRVNIGPDDEIGSSDVSAYVREVERALSEQDMSEAEYQGRKVALGKPMQGDVKKSKVYVKNPQGNVVKVNFGDPNMTIKKSNPARRKSFRARHNCDNPGPRHKARYWSCRAW
jgi:hypothetical protein